MSAFLVSDAHLCAIVNFAALAFARDNYMPHGIPVTTEPQKLGELLYAANVASVDYRYPAQANETAPKWKLQPSPLAVNSPHFLVPFLKLLDCLEYQSCERNDWEQSQAYKAIQALRCKAISKLPGYEAAPWALPE